MKSAALAMVVSLLLLSSSRVFAAADVDTDGATVGKWTMDFDAAKTLAKKKKLPVLLNFTGSDWCGWCKLMDRKVFTKQEWKDYAADNLVMVFVDFPRNSDLVPKKYVARNRRLSNKFGVKGYPTYVVLDNDANTVLARLGAGRNKTPKSFIAEIASATRNSAGSAASFAEKLSPAKKREYMKIVDRMAKNRKQMQAEKDRIAKAQAKVKELELEDAKLKDATTELRVSTLGREKLAEYKQLQSDLDAEEKKLKDWMATGPQQTQENTKKYQSMQSKIQTIKEKLGEF